jgi:glycosyltransferase involved in cell wall biosynthesis
MDISVVIPLKDEEESLPELIGWIDEVLRKNNFSFEVIAIDDGSTDRSWAVLQELKQKYPFLKALSFRRNYGKSAALNEGFKLAEGDVVITMDADLQDSPEEIPDLYRLIMVEKFDLISGWKKVRHDPVSKTVPTKLFNWATRQMSGIHLHDFNCGLKAYKRDVVKSIEIYGEMHRYIPVLAKWDGFRKIGEKVVQHRARKYGTTKFGLERFTNGFLDLLTITFVSRFGKRPMHFFGTLGIISFLVGALFVIWLFIDKMMNIHNPHARDITDKPSFYLTLMLMVIGTLLFLGGFLGEMIARSNPERNNYQNKDRIV